MNSNKLKKIIFSILKEILEGESVPSAKDYDITEAQFREIILLMINDNLLNHRRVSFFIDGSLHIEKSINTLTMKGVEFLEENNNLSKIYRGIKEIKSFFS